MTEKPFTLEAQPVYDPGEVVTADPWPRPDVKFRPSPTFRERIAAWLLRLKEVWVGGPSV